MIPALNVDKEEPARELPAREPSRIGVCTPAAGVTVPDWGGSVATEKSRLKISPDC